MSVTDDNDPLSTMGDPTGFPRIVLYELRPFQIVQTPNQVLILYMFEKRWRVIWTDGRALPANPNPRWYGYSVGRWVDDDTLVRPSGPTIERGSTMRAIRTATASARKSDIIASIRERWS